MASDLRRLLIAAALLLSVDRAAGYDIVISRFSEGEAYCFKYRWVSSENINSYNCTGSKNVPCIEPQITGDSLPNTTKLWEDKDNNSDYLCSANAGSSCIKYTFLYNSKVVNTSSFCGKVIEDNTLPVISGCYQQHVNGYLLEMCVCPPRIGREPCNTSSSIRYSNSFIGFMVLLVYARLSYLV